MKATEADRERMRELRRSGLGIEEISRIMGFSTGTVWATVKDVPVPIGLYQKRLLVGLFDGAIMDIETTGLNPDMDDIITFGFLVENRVTVMQRIDASAKEFCEAAKSRISELPCPLYAYNARFEKAFLSSKLGVELDIVDIFQPWMERAESEGVKYPALDELARLPREYFREKPLKGEEVTFLWRSYQKTREKRKLSPIVRHCMEDLIQGLYVLAQVNIPIDRQG